MAGKSLVVFTPLIFVMGPCKIIKFFPVNEGMKVILM